MLDFDNINIELSRWQREGYEQAHEKLSAQQLGEDFRDINRSSNGNLHPPRYVLDQAHELNGEFR
jgi:hypothetical protein